MPSKSEKKLLIGEHRRMDLIEVIRQLLAEKKQLDSVIASLELLEKPGSAPLAQETVALPKARRGRRSMSTDERKRVSERMRRYWRGRKGGEDPGTSPRTKTAAAGETERALPATEVRVASSEKRKARS